MDRTGRKTAQADAQILSDNGYFTKRFLSLRGIWFWSGLLALLCTLISYPGIWYSDSYVRVTTGEAVLNAIVKTLTGRRFPLDTGNAFSVIPSFFMAISQGLTGHVGLYTFMQAFAFFAATFLLIRDLNPESPRLQSVLFALCPLIYGMSVYYEAGIGCVAGMVCLLLLFRRAGEEKNGKDRILEFLLVAFASFVTVGYRTNALTVLPVLVFYALRMKADRVRKGMLLLAVLVGLLFTKALPWVFNVRSESTASVGIVWEMLTVIQRMEPEEQELYLDYLDEIGGEGATRAALRTSTEGTAGDFMWGQALGTGKLSAPGATGKALKKYVRLILDQPGNWIRVKWCFVRKSLGLGEALDYSEYNYNRWESMSDFGFNDSLQRHAFYDSFMKAVQFFGFYVLHPWLPFTVSLLMLVIETVRQRKRQSFPAFVFWMAVFYYLAYLLDTPAFDFRYFYPSLFLMLILDVAIALKWLAALFGRVRKKTASGRA